MREHWLLLMVIFPLSATPARAQRLWLAPEPGRNVGLEITKGFFRSGSDLEFASFVVTAEGRFPVNNTLAITAALPFSRVSESGSFVTNPRSTAFGNPWIGIEAIAEPDLIVEAGIRPGITSETSTSASAQGMAFDVDFDRFEACLPKWTSMRAMAHVGRIPAQGTFVTGLFGGTLFLPSGGGGAWSMPTTVYASAFGTPAPLPA
jgi:hypothetical protein